MIKRTFDFVLSSVMLLVLSPLLLLLAALIKRHDGGPVFYRGLRVGKGGKPFRIFKFRSMVVNAEKVGGSSSGNSDPRITPVGSFLRRYKLDELPQLLNVFLGDMSFVGPRPEVQRFVDLYSAEEKAILRVRPGITDWASIKFNNEADIISQSGIADADEAYLLLIRPEKLRLQLEYVRDHSLWTDLKIMAATLETLLYTRTQQAMPIREKS